jgi:hypothetical protein
LIYGGSAVLHPGTAPHETEAAFAHYAQESNWALIHLGELLGILLMSTASIALAWRLRQVSIVWPTLAGAAIVVFAAVYAVFIAVDGVHGIMVERWVQAPPERQELLYEAAFAVRQIEAGLFGIQWLMFGFATGLFSAAFFASSATPFGLTWMSAMGWLSALASLGALLFGIAQAASSAPASGSTLSRSHRRPPGASPSPSCFRGRSTCSRNAQWTVAHLPGCLTAVFVRPADVDGVAKQEEADRKSPHTPDEKTGLEGHRSLGEAQLSCLEDVRLSCGVAVLIGRERIG